MYTNGDLAMTILELKNKRLMQYLIAEEKILSGQSYSIGGRILTRADLKVVRQAIDELLAEGATLDGDKTKFGRTKRAVFVD